MEFPWNVGCVGEHVSAGGQALTQGQRGNLCSLRNVENQAFFSQRMKYGLQLLRSGFENAKMYRSISE